MTLPPDLQNRTPKTFHMSRPKDFLDKLAWELDQLEQCKAYGGKEAAYYAMNCATTAWHMADWVFSFMTPEQQLQYGGGKNEKRFQLAAYREFLKRESPDLRICRELADAMKHRTIDHKPDDDIETAQMTMASYESGADVEYIFLLFGNQIAVPHVVIRNALHYWSVQLDLLGMTSRG